MEKLKGRKPMELTDKNVEKAFLDCLFKEDEIATGKLTTDPVRVDGITSTFVFHAKRLSGQRTNIADMCDQLADIENGPSFLNLCNRKDGIQWTDLHQSMEQLIALGVGVEVLKYCLPKEMWDLLPCGMPMIIKNQKTAQKESDAKTNGMLGTSNK